MITKEEYLIAKHIVQEYEKEIKNHSIGVISLDAEDFMLWKEDIKLFGDGLETRKRFKIGNITYFCISNLNDLCSVRFDEVIETNYAKENEIYEDIKTYININ